jgi:magnesium-transporting ATPase (P-type)
MNSKVAVTGEGLNDVDGLKTADVSFCMGSGCEVAKEASQIIFIDDNFNSVYKATLWGRNVIDNIRKFLQFQLAINIVCVFIVFLGGATLGNSPFSIIQLLWINLIMDAGAAISLATEPPNENDEDNHRIIRKRGEAIIQSGMWRNIFAQVFYQGLVLVIMLYSIPFWFPNSSYNLVNGDFYSTGDDSRPIKQHFTIMFNTFVLMNLVNMIACRKIGWSDTLVFRIFFNNKYFFFVWFLEFGV